MTAKDIMSTNVINVSRHTTIYDAVKIMVEAKISGLIITDDDQNVVGVVSERDMMMAYDLLQEVKSTIEDFINFDVVSVSPDTEVGDVNKLLIQSNVKRVPVIENGKCLGVISRGDILKYIFDHSSGV